MCDGVVSGDPVPGEEPAWFAPQAGGVVSAQHEADFPDSPARRISPGALKTLRALSNGSNIQMGREMRLEIRTLLSIFFTWHLGKKLRVASMLGNDRTTSRREP